MGIWTHFEGRGDNLLIELYVGWGRKGKKGLPEFRSILVIRTFYLKEHKYL